MMPIHTIRSDEEAYPPRLLRLESPPAQLWVRGRLDLAAPTVAIVGTRAASGEGQAIATQLSAALCRHGAVVISGGALGIDAAAHQGALLSTGRTCVVLGCGADITYPRRHEDLFTQIAEHGALLSSFPPGTPPKDWHFPARNHLIAALADAVVVVESREGSGSHHTAERARRLGVPVFARLGSPGADSLFRRGALPLHDEGDVLQVLALPTIEEGAARSAPAREALLDHSDQVRAALTHIPCDIGELSRRTGLPGPACAAAVIDLELHGFCLSLAGSRYISVKHAS